MLVYNVISIICLAMIAAIFATVVVKIIVLKHPERVVYIRNFKKGKAAIIYVIAIPLYCLNGLYSGKDILEALFDAISKSIYLIALKFDPANIKALSAVNGIYKVTIYVCFAAVILNALMLTLSFFFQWIWGEWRNLRFMCGKEERCIILGGDEKGEVVYQSAPKKRIIVDFLSKEAQAKLYVKGISYKSFKPEGEKEYQAWLFTTLDKLIAKLKAAEKKTSKKKLEKQKINIIICEKKQKLNLLLCGKLVEYLKTVADDDLEYIDAYVFGDRQFETIYAQYQKYAKGSLHYINEYRQVAIDFIDKYPLTEFMDERQIDYDTSLIKKEVDLNVVMLGFGKTNQQVYHSMVANNQFLTEGAGGKYTEKLVFYHLFDRTHGKENKSSDYKFFRYSSTFYKDGKPCVNTEEKKENQPYLPLPARPCEEDYQYWNTKDDVFFEKLQEALSFKEESLNYIVISLGEDYESLNITNKIVMKLKEWALENCQVFVRVRDVGILKDAKILLDNKNCHSFGSNKEVIYNYSQIVGKKFSEMAMMQDCVYNIERDMKHDQVTAAEKKKARLKWFVEYNAIKRESNIYACLSLRGKLHLMGFDYVPEDKAEGVSEEVYLSKYAKDDMPLIVRDPETKEQVAVRYPLEFKDSRRKTMAILEHNRWNAYMITRGFIPALKSLIKAEKIDGKHTDGQSYELRRHGCLTTFDGLLEYRKMISAPNRSSGRTEKDNDVIKYDYQLLDGAWWLLHKNGYKLVERKKRTVEQTNEKA